MADGFRGEKFRFAAPGDAVDHLRGLVVRVSTERVEFSEAGGRVLAEDICTDRPSPAFDYSAMDGFALAVSDAASGRLPVRGEVRIGQTPCALTQGSAMRIVTGAAIPMGADAVVKREDVEERDGAIVLGPEVVAGLHVGASIRRRGENADAGSVLVASGSEVTAASVGAIASAGHCTALVYRRLRVAVVSTGDELVGAAEQPAEFQIRDGNGPAVVSLLQARGWVGEVWHERVRDDPGELEAAVGRAERSADALVLSGGVSMGHRDHVREALERGGVRVEFHGLPQRPGKPVLGGLWPDGRPVFGLPGNPVSTLVMATRLMLPVLRRMAGAPVADASAAVRLVGEADAPIGLWWHRLVRVLEDGSAEALRSRGSGDVVGLAQSDGFVEIPPKASGEGPWPLYRWN